MPKITFIGAGSTVFAKSLLVDILSFPELAEAVISLHDVDPTRLQTTQVVAHHIARALDVRPTIESTTDRREALDGSDYVLCMIQVGGYKPSTVIDFEVPKKYGLRQTIADTLGIGGIMRGLRTIPVLLEMCRDMEALCPEVTFLNYVNPLAINCWAINQTSSINTIGLCHSIPHTAQQLADDVGVPLMETSFLVAGINHLAFFLEFHHHGQDLYPQLYQVIQEGRVPDGNRVRYEVLQRLGYFVTESSEHLSEYVPWFIKRDRPDLIERFNIPLDEYMRRCEQQIADWDDMRVRLEQGEFPVAVDRSVDYGSLIIHSMEMGIPRVVYGNVTNNGIIENLPDECVVEVPCLVDRNGLQPTHIGQLPTQLWALIQTHVNVQALTVEAALKEKRDAIYHAAMLDPHTAAELDLDQIWALVDDLISAHGDWLPKYT